MWNLQNIALFLAIGGYVAFVICMRAKEWRKNKETAMQKVYFPLNFPMHKLQEFAKQNNCTLYRTLLNEYNMIPNQVNESTPDKATLGASNVVSIQACRAKAANQPQGAA